jgi:plastocyanin
MRSRTSIVLLLWTATCGAALSLPEAHGSVQPRLGRIEGRVTFSGRPPRGIDVDVTGATQPALHVGADGGVRFAVVYLPDARPGSEAPPTETAVVNQRRFVFEPQVLAVRAGQLVRFTNEDPANHNVRARGHVVANTFSINTASGATDAAGRAFQPTLPDQPLELTCDLHPWMTAWLYVFAHDLHAVTDAQGRFRIDEVPEGMHRLAVRQPGGRLARNLAVQVKGGETARVDVGFTAADVGLPAR